MRTFFIVAGAIAVAAVGVVVVRKLRGRRRDAAQAGVEQPDPAQTNEWARAAPSNTVWPKAVPPDLDEVVDEIVILGGSDVDLEPFSQIAGDGLDLDIASGGDRH